MARVIIIPVIFLVMLTCITHAQNPLNDKSRLELRAGVWTGSESKVMVLLTEVETNVTGGSAQIEYSRFYKENLAFTVSTGVLAVDVTSKQEGLNGLYVNIGSSLLNLFEIHPLLFGLRYYFPQGSYETSFRPFATTKIGPYIGTGHKTMVGENVYVLTETQMVFGTYLGGGIDLLLTKNLFLGFNAGYHALTDFSDTIGSKKNYSGGEYMIGLGYMW